MNIFNWAQDHNINFIENIDWWMLNNLSSKLYAFIRGKNGLTDERAQDICRLMFNDICIDGLHGLVRVIGFGDDGEDYYCISKDRNGKVVWHSMVSSLISLKNKISNWDYYRIERQFEGWEGHPGLCPKEKEFLVDIKPYKE